MADSKAGETSTANYGWIKPNPGASDDVWGGYLNQTLDGIDAVVHGIDTRSITQAYVDAGDAARVLKAGDTMTGSLKLPNGSNAVPALNFGTANTGLLGNAAGTSISMSFAGSPIYTFQQSSFVSIVNIRAADGLVGGAGFGFSSEPSSGLYRKGGGSVSVTGAASEVMNWNATGNTTTAYGPVILAADPTVALGAATKQYVDAIPTTYPIGDNRIINGDMRINQRGVNSGTAGGYTVDRWAFSTTQVGKITWSSITGPGGSGGATGSPYNLKYTSSSAYTPISTDAIYGYQPIEAEAISDFAWGTASAKSVTLSFWVYSSQAGTYSGAVTNIYGTSTTDRSYPFSFSIPTANVWTKCVINIPGETSGAWALTGNTAGVYVRFDLGSGANFRAPAGAWANGNFVGATGAASVCAVNGGSIYFTSVKLEIGNIATPFNRQSLAKSMADCQRYYQTHSNLTLNFNHTGVGAWSMSYPFPVTMRGTPAIVVTQNNQGNVASFAAGGAAALTDSFQAQITTAAAGFGYFNFSYTANAEL